MSDQVEKPIEVLAHENIVTSRKVEMRVARTTNVRKLADSIAMFLQSGKKVRLVAIGAGSVNQMVKATAKANMYLAPKGITVFWKTFFTDRDEGVKVDGEETQEPVSAVGMESHVED